MLSNHNYFLSEELASPLSSDAATSRSLPCFIFTPRFHVSCDEVIPTLDVRKLMLREVTYFGQDHTVKFYQS